MDDRRLIHHVETNLKKTFVIGAGNALYLQGWCYHTIQRIKKLYILVDDVPHLVSNFSFARPDVFQKHFQKIDNKGNSLNSGFWSIIPFAPTDSKRRVSLVVRAVLRSDEVCESTIGTITLEPTPIAMDTCSYSANAESFETPLVSICMTTYNPPIELFKKQIDSIIRQTHKNWICTINDDCSKPELFEKIRDITAADRRFKVYRNSSNSGFYHNFERCLSLVSKDASFIALADQDDYWYEDKLSVLLSYFDDDTTLAYSDMSIVDENGEIIHNTYWTTRKNNFKELDLLILANTITGAASLFRRELLYYILPFPQKVGDSYHDHFIACTALTKGRIKYVEKPLYAYTQHSDNVLGHYAPKNNSVKKRLSEFLRKLKENLTISGCFSNIKRILYYNQAVYFNHYPRRALIAHVISLRCDINSKKKKNIIKRFVHLENSASMLILQIAKDKIIRSGSTTLSLDSLLLKSALSNKLINIYFKFRRNILFLTRE